MKRRTYLTTASVVAATAIAGCTGGEADGSDDEEHGDDETDDREDHGDETEREDEEEDDRENGDDEEEEDEDDELPELVGTFDDFEDLEAWSTVSGTLEADGDRAYEGSQSAHLTASESETQVRIVRELSEPIDVEAVVPGLALATSSAANPVIQLHDADGDYLQFRQHVREGHPFVRHSFGHTDVSGDPDPTEITEIHITHWVGDEAEGELWVDDLHFVPRVETGKVLLQFQGGFETDHSLAFPVMEEYDLPGSTFVATSRIRASENDDGARLTEGQLAELTDAGWSVGTVGARGLHLHRVESDEVESDILSPLEWFDEHGYDDARYFAFPGGRYDEGMYDLVEENYDLGFAGRYRSHGWASNRLNVPRISGDADQRNLDADQMIDALDWTAEHGGITTIVFYEMDDDDAEALEETAAHLTALESAGDLELITPREIADEYVY